MSLEQKLNPEGHLAQWNPLQADVYTDYLIALSESNQITAQRDIFSTEGNLLVKSSSVLSKTCLEQLKGKPLLHPLYESIHLDEMITAERLLDHLLNAIRSSEFFQSLEERKYPLACLEPVCAVLSAYPLIQQFLTVMAAQLNDLFDRTLAAGLWSLYIAQEMRLAPEDTYAVFWAAITRDLGMMHIDPEIVNRSHDLMPEEWIHLHSHVDISTTILLNIPGVPSAVITAVAEHHERCDGTGYPMAKVESELSLLGQIVALADAIVGIYFNHFKSTGRRWREVIPVLELNRTAYLYRSCEIVATMITRSELPLDNVAVGNEVPEFAERMLQHNIYLQSWFSHLRECLTAVGFTHGDRKLHALQNVVLHIATTFRGSMLFKEDLRKSLEMMSNEQSPNISKLVTDAALIQQEMEFHLQRLSRMLQMYLASGECKSEAIAKQLEAGLTKISGYLTHQQ
jgi:HD-GYP domain-containing protein (c-di-GMP phosphodiesterase class II)